MVVSIDPVEIFFTWSFQAAFAKIWNATVASVWSTRKIPDSNKTSRWFLSTAKFLRQVLFVFKPLPEDQTSSLLQPPSIHPLLPALGSEFLAPLFSFRFSRFFENCSCEQICHFACVIWQIGCSVFSSTPT